MEQLVTSEFKLGIIAGGQLGKMLVLAASNWDVKTFVLDADEQCPASTCCTQFVKGNHLDFDDVYNFGKMVDMITFEIESVNIDALKKLKQEGKRINPDPDILEIIQDKGLQKQFYAQHKIPSSSFKLFNNKIEIENALRQGELKFPFVQKLCKGGYDGKGVSVIKNENDINNLLEGISVIEDLVEIAKEISIIAARNERGEVRCFPIVEMEFNEKANLIEKLICPASLNDSIVSEAIDLAIKIISSLNLRGILAVEMFLDKENKIWINEVAPRPHNSGHHTIESIVTSQYEQLLRAIFNFPLGSTQLKLPAVMINLLGEPDHDGAVKYEGITECMSIDGVKIHLYGKKKTKPFRKMGHVTVLASTINEAIEKAEIVKQKLKAKAW
ncbi:MAG: 5-(carboxyamino)imidazole ribonucleotide synthase [Chitinophagales bacterium]|nr:5-(carboxyamino)imidazole ribonucleotide synthase [Chitinophagales bacterium]